MIASLICSGIWLLGAAVLPAALLRKMRSTED